MDADPDDAQRGAIPRLGRDAVGHYGAMTTYDGPATAIASGIEYPVTASLAIASRGNGKTWHGTLTAEDERAAWEIFDDEDTQLRIGDRLPEDFRSASFDAHTAEVVIQGRGSAPFGY
ncbi:hypothetical protein [Streptomyces sp. KL116D]|uniref:hypothetical protein n=1 Tax=Streptomyces sp. KL116D TaxID=3045152 RepID=UPI0035566B11